MEYIDRPRKSSILKLVVVVLISVNTLFLLTCLIGFLYWHLRISQSMRDLRKGSSSEKARSIIASAKCRAIPYLVEALDSAEKQGDVEWQELICWQLAHNLGRSNRSESPDRVQHNSSPPWNPIFSSDSKEVASEKSLVIRDWWKRESRCYPPRLLFWLSYRYSTCR
jgi:hypothetical protein